MAIAEEHQLTAAAKRLHITQPPLSYELSSLERELGVKLVSHTSRSVELMDAEKLLYVRAAQIVDATSSQPNWQSCGAVVVISCRSQSVSYIFLLEFATRGSPAKR